MQAASYNMQQVTCKTCNKSYKLQGNGRRHIPCLPIRDAFSQQVADTIDWTVRCEWLQVASSCNIVHAQYYANEGCKTCASLAGLLASFIVVVRGA